MEDVRERIVGAVTLQLNQIEELGYIGAFSEDHGVRVMPVIHRHESAHRLSWDVPQAASAA